MYNQDPRLAYAQYLQSVYGYAPSYVPAQGLGFGTPTHAPISAPVYGQPQFGGINQFGYGAQLPVQTLPVAPVAMNEAQWLLQFNELRTQIAALTEIVRHDLVKHQMNEMAAQTPVQNWQGLGYGVAPIQQRGFNTLGNVTGIHSHGLHAHGLHAHGMHGIQNFQGIQGFNGGIHADVSPIRLRENDSHTFCEIYLPQVTIGDVEVEVQGNRITCRTRVPVAPLTRWLQATQMPRGFELFELPDGRIEFCWISTTPFIAKEVEASFKEGFLCICVPKTEIVARHTVKVVKETAATRRASGEMNS